MYVAGIQDGIPPRVLSAWTLTPGVKTGDTGQAQKRAPAAWRRRSGCFPAPQSQPRCLKTQRGSNTVKKLRFMAFAAAALALPLGAQVTKTLRADIPFE